MPYRFFFVFFISLLSLSCGKKYKAVVLTEQAKNSNQGKQFLLHKISDKEIAIGLPNKPDALVFPLDRPFLALGKATPKVKYSLGSFRFKDKDKEICEEQTISSIQQTDSTLHISGELCGTIYHFKAVQNQANELMLSVKSDNEQQNRLFLTYKSTKDEAFLGMGEQFSHVNLKGHRVPIWVEEQGVGRGDQPITAVINMQIMAGGDNYTSYAPMPFYLSNQGKAVLLHNNCRSVFDFTKDEMTQVEIWDNEMDMTIWQADKPLDLIEAYTEKTGRLPLMPEWAYGAIIGMQGGSDIVPPRIDTLLEAGAPITGLWIQDWCGQRQTPYGSQLRWYWEADQTHYKDFKNFCGNMNEKGIDVLGYINPFLTEFGDLFEQASKNNYLVKDPAGKNYKIKATGFDTYLIDFTNPAAYNWTKDLIKKNMIEMGLSGWMADFGEWLPWDAVMHSGISAEEYHNQYPVIWEKINREAVQETENEGKVAFFSRAGYTESNKHVTFYWAGDQMVNWGKHDGLPSVVPALLSSGISGMSINHGDIGGFASSKRWYFKIKRSRELLKRWIELCAFSPIYRTHECILPLDNLQVYSDQDMREFYTKFAKLHFALKPYLKQYAQEAHERGFPMVRHLYLHYPEDPEVLNLQNQYLLGEDILVIPVIQEGKTNVKGYLPEGEWQHFFTKKVYQGKNWQTFDAPIGEPAIFIKKGSRVLMEN